MTDTMIPQPEPTAAMSEPGPSPESATATPMPEQEQTPTQALGPTPSSGPGPSPEPATFAKSPTGPLSTPEESSTPESSEESPTPESSEESPEETSGLESPEESPEVLQTGSTTTSKSSMVAEEKKPTGVKGKLKEIADDYVIPISDDGLTEWSKTIDDKDVGKFKDYAKQVAEGLYPSLMPQLEMGITTKILLDPYVEVAKQVLGHVATEPNWLDPKWSAALNGGSDSKTGRPIPMTLSEWRQHLMTEPGHNFVNSPLAMEKANSFVQHLNAAFTGKITGGE